MISYGFFNSVNGDRTYDADDISNYFLKLISNGVFATPSSAMQVTVSSGMTVQVSAGWGFINCKWIENNAPYLLTLDASDVVLNRIDRIVLRLDETNRQMGIYIRKGAPAASPVPPTLQRTTGQTWELSLAQVAVNAGATSITQADIIDERANTSVCGWVTGLIDQIDTTNLFAQFTASFNEWFADIKQTLSTTTLVRQYTSTYTTTAPSETVIPINITQYNYTLDVLNVYVNGLRLIPDVDYTENASANTITLANALDVVGTEVAFEILKSIDGSEAESVVDMVYQLQTELGKIDANNYYCNGVNDNVTLPQWIASWQQGHQQKCRINIIGTFGVDQNTTTAPDGNEYSLVYASNGAYKLTLDFSQCEVIVTSRNSSFAYFSNCTVKGLMVTYDDVTNSSALTAIAANSATLENCDVYGTLTGSNPVTVYSVTGCRMIECDCRVYSDDAITGIKALTSIITCCNIWVSSDGASKSAYGIDMGDASRADNSTFSATTNTSSNVTSGCGGIGGGYYSNCAFYGFGGFKGNGFYVRSGYLLNANNCIFRGYTGGASGGWGYGITGVASDATTLILTGINCNQVAETGYSQTGSLVFTQGYGSYMGCFYTAPSVPSTIVSFGTFVRNRT